MCLCQNAVRASHPGKGKPTKARQATRMDSLSLFSSNPKSTNAIIVNILKVLKEKEINPFYRRVG